MKKSYALALCNLMVFISVPIRSMVDFPLWQPFVTAVTVFGFFASVYDYVCRLIKALSGVSERSSRNDAILHICLAAGILIVILILCSTSVFQHYRAYQNCLSTLSVGFWLLSASVARAAKIRASRKTE